jgi:predicted acetyltransferase
VPELEVLPAGRDQVAVVANLMELYLHDFSPLVGADVGAEGRYGYDLLDRYWLDADRVPFLFRVDGRWAGFALVHTGDPHDMAEFFVLRKYRRQGVGQEAARTLFARFPGGWLVRQITANPEATRFWRTAIPVAFEDGTNPKGPEQRFTIP